MKTREIVRYYRIYKVHLFAFISPSAIQYEISKHLPMTLDNRGMAIYSKGIAGWWLQSHHETYVITMVILRFSQRSWGIFFFHLLLHWVTHLFWTILSSVCLTLIMGYSVCECFHRA